MVDETGRGIEREHPSPVSDPRFWPVLMALAEAHDLGLAAGRDVWQFALEIQALGQLGVSYSQMRLLITEGLIEHRLETSRPTDRERKFRRTKNLALLPESRFVISARGLELARSQGTGAIGTAGDGKPRWDPGRRELWFGGQRVKALKGQAKNQEPVLAAFQEQGWPQCIECPLLAVGDQSRGERLMYALKALNRSQEPPAIHFHGNGTGRCVCWRPIG
jgi:hypothetical protein